MKKNLCSVLTNNIFDEKRTYLFVAGPHHDMIDPVMNKTIPCNVAVLGSLGNSSSKIAAKGIADPVLI